MRRRRTVVRLAAALVPVLVSGCGGSPQADLTGDLALTGGRVMDPASGTDTVATVLIRGDRVVAVTGEPVRAPDTVDASGLVVAPGFVDILAPVDAEDEPQRYKIKDGVTTTLDMHGEPVDVEGWYAAFEEQGPLVNHGMTVGHPEIREALGHADDYSPLTDVERERAKELAARAIEDGALGVGFGINYTPGAPYDEVLDLFEVAAEHGVPAHVHSRHKGSVFPGDILLSVQEVIADAAVTGASAQVVHLASSAIGSMDEALRMIEGARAHGVDVAADIHPYLANNTTLESALYDPGWQERFGGITYDSIMVVETGERLTEESFRAWRDRGASVITFFIPREEMLMALTHPLVMVASDGAIEDGRGHPRGGGTFARLLGRLARDEGHLSLMEALRKITVMPAERMSEADPCMARRGRLQEGAFADITVFDPERIVDRATYREPDRYSEGVVHVLVNGVPVLEDGAFTGERPGRAVRHRAGDAGAACP